MLERSCPQFDVIVGISYVLKDGEALIPTKKVLSVLEIRVQQDQTPLREGTKHSTAKGRGKNITMILGGLF